jgi:hypothetical protein
MLTAHFLEYAALAVAVGGLMAVIAEIVAHDPRLLGKITSDVRKFATEDDTAVPLERPRRHAAGRLAGGAFGSAT